MPDLFSDHSDWIWLDASDAPNRYMEAETEFDYAGGPLALHITVEGQYAAFVNGERVPSTQFSDFPAAKAVQCPNVTQLARPGKNVLRVQCWYPGADTSVTRKEPPGLRFELRAGGRVLAASGPWTRVRAMTEYVDGPIARITPQLGVGFERRLAEKESWRRATCVEKPAHFVLRAIRELRIEPCPSAKVVSQGTFQCVGGGDVGERMQTAGLFWRSLAEMSGQRAAVLPLENGLRLCADHGDGLYLVLDLGKLCEGYLVLDATCPEETRIDVGFGEHLDDLRVRTSVGGRCFAVSCTAGSTRERFVHWFRRFGCRYLQLFIHSHEAMIHEVGVLPARYPVDEQPRLTLADPLHNRIAEVCRETLVACMHDHYEDCPWREQALYAFDSRNQMLAGYYAFGEFTFARENLRLLTLSQRADGLLELCAPARIPITIPSFSLAFVMELEEYCWYSGDLAFGREMLPVAERILDVLAGQCRDGLAWRFEGSVYWNFYEWQPMLDDETPRFDGPSADAGLQLFGLLALQRLTALRKMLGLPGRDGDWALERSLTAGLERFWDGSRGAYASFIRGGERMHYAELIQALALCAGVVPEKRRGSLRRKLLGGGLVPVTLSYSLFKYEALLQDPSHAEAVFGEVARRWGSMLLRGATTFWEVDEGAEAFDRAGSLCHGWSAIPYYLYGAYALGVRPEGPGLWRQYPPMGKLEARATLLTPHGCIDVCSNRT